MAATAKGASTRTYEAHRDRQRRRILDATEKVFDERSIDRTTMAHIISATGLRTSTVYQYFFGKDEIVWALLEEELAETALRMKLATAARKSALAKIRALLELMADDLTKRQDEVLSGAIRCDVRPGVAG